MADPAKYTPTYNFTAFQAQSPTSPMPAPRLDEQFDNISQSVNQGVDALADIRRSDGQLKNGIVTPESLSAALNVGFTMAGQWLVGESYNGGDGVVHNQKFYVALIANVATPANAPDLDASTWSYLFSVDDLVVAGALSIPVVSGVGDGTTKTFTLPVAPASVNNVFAKVGVNVLSINAYTVSGPSITLATAPAIGVAYEFRILSTIAVTELEQAVYDARDTAIAKAAAAGVSAANAAASVTAASNSATAAANSATSADNSKTAAASSATAAAGSASAANTSATNAASSASAAAGSASAASGSASAANTSATNAAGSETNAASSASAAGNSATSASNSAAAALASANEAIGAADRAENAASAVEYPVSYAPQTLTGPQQAQARTNIGLGNVDNTSDANKPISTATQTALNAKQNNLGFTPVRQGGFSGAGNSIVSIGWGSTGNNLVLNVDATNFGSTWPINIDGNAVKFGGKTSDAYALIDWISTVGLISNDSNRPYVMRKSDGAIVEMATKADVNARVSDTRFAGAIQGDMTIPETGFFAQKLTGSSGYVITTIWTTGGTRTLSVTLRQPQIFINGAWRPQGAW